MAKCLRCEAEFPADLVDNKKSDQQTFTCPECQAKHIATLIPTPAGSPAKFEYRLVDE
jgi:DNA-directed RNA polymerase subunit RPC12/RpoP